MVNELRRIDLNLLVTLDALLREHNVTRAAERLHLSQPSVSVHLAKLREVFGDPLLLPGPRGMRPTARAEVLREPLQQALAALAQAVTPEGSFDPATATNTWRVAASDYGATTLLLPVLAKLRTLAPDTRLAIMPLGPKRIARQAEQGDLDLAFHISAEAPPGMRSRPLFTERYLLVGRKGHPQLQQPLTLERFCALEQVLLSQDGGGFFGVVDQALAERNLSRKLVLSVPNFLLLRELLTTTDLVAMLPARLVSENKALIAVEPPLAVPGFEMVMLWPERSHRDPAHQWLRELIVGNV
jgi:DNA-binding transcriptional LysR family regulator